MVKLTSASFSCSSALGTLARPGWTTSTTCYNYQNIKYIESNCKLNKHFWYRFNWRERSRNLLLTNWRRFKRTFRMNFRVRICTGNFSPAISRNRKEFWLYESMKDTDDQMKTTLEFKHNSQNKWTMKSEKLFWWNKKIISRVWLAAKINLNKFYLFS